MIEETHSATTAECESQLSPHGLNTIKSFNDTTNTSKNPRADFSFNFNLTPKVFEVKRLVNTGRPSQYPRSSSFHVNQISSNSPSKALDIQVSNNIQLVMRKGSMTVSSTDPISKSNTMVNGMFTQDKNFSNSMFNFQNKVKSEQEKENEQLERLLKNKRVFRVIRDQKPVQNVVHNVQKRNIKRVASTPIEEENIMPKLKQVKSQPKSHSGTTAEYFTFNIPLDFQSNNNGTYFDFSQLPTFQNNNNYQPNTFSSQRGNQNYELDFFSKF